MIVINEYSMNRVFVDCCNSDWTLLIQNGSYDRWVILEASNEFLSTQHPIVVLNQQTKVTINYSTGFQLVNQTCRSMGRG